MCTKKTWCASSDIISVVTAHFAPKYSQRLCSSFTSVFVHSLSNNTFTTYNAKLGT